MSSLISLDSFFKTESVTTREGSNDSIIMNSNNSVSDTSMPSGIEVNSLSKLSDRLNDSTQFTIGSSIDDTISASTLINSEIDKMASDFISDIRPYVVEDILTHPPKEHDPSNVKIEINPTNKSEESSNDKNSRMQSILDSALNDRNSKSDRSYLTLLEDTSPESNILKSEFELKLNSMTDDVTKEYINLFQSDEFTQFVDSSVRSFGIDRTTEDINDPLMNGRLDYINSTKESSQSDTSESTSDSSTKVNSFNIKKSDVKGTSKLDEVATTVLRDFIDDISITVTSGLFSAASFALNGLYKWVYDSDLVGAVVDGIRRLNSTLTSWYDFIPRTKLATESPNTSTRDDYDAITTESPNISTRDDYDDVATESPNTSTRDDYSEVTTQKVTTPESKSIGINTDYDYRIIGNFEKSTSYSNLLNAVGSLFFNTNFDWSIKLEPYDKEMPTLYKAYGIDESTYSFWLPIVSYNITESAIGEIDLPYANDSMKIPYDYKRPISITLNLVDMSPGTKDGTDSAIRRFKEQYIDYVKRGNRTNDLTIRDYRVCYYKLSLYRAPTGRASKSDKYVTTYYVVPSINVTDSGANTRQVNTEPISFNIVGIEKSHY